MSSGLQDVIDRAAVTSGQRWILSMLAVATAAVGSVVTVVAAGGVPVMPVVVTVVAIAAVLRPDSHVALIAIVLVLAHWVIGVDDATTPLSVAVAAALGAFHALVALLAVTPPTVTVDAGVLGRWARRSLLAVVPAGWTWLTVVVLAEREAPGSVALTTLALVTLAIAAVVVRLRTGE